MTQLKTFRWRESPKLSGRPTVGILGLYGGSQGQHHAVKEMHPGARDSRQQEAQKTRDRPHP